MKSINKFNGDKHLIRERYVRSNMRWCKGKPQYDKKSAISAKNKRFRQDHTELRVYHCPSCNFWHLTSQLEKYEKNRNKKTYS